MQERQEIGGRQPPVTESICTRARNGIIRRPRIFSREGTHVTMMTLPCYKPCLIFSGTYSPPI